MPERLNFKFHEFDIREDKAKVVFNFNFREVTTYLRKNEKLNNWYILDYGEAME